MGDRRYDRHSVWVSKSLSYLQQETSIMVLRFTQKKYICNLNLVERKLEKIIEFPFVCCGAV